MAQKAHDLVIRGGQVADGRGGEPVTADVAVDAGTVTAVGAVPGRGSEEIDAGGLLVTPGFVDIHTHYDGQATWDGRITPSSWHGVTTAVMGNCGVGFAPVRPDAHNRLISLMEGVEDIPGAVLDEGIDWSWETFGEYLDAVERRPTTSTCARSCPTARCASTSWESGPPAWRRRRRRTRRPCAAWRPTPCGRVRSDSRPRALSTTEPPRVTRRHRWRREPTSSRPSPRAWRTPATEWSS